MKFCLFLLCQLGVTVPSLSTIKKIQLPGFIPPQMSSAVKILRGYNYFVGLVLFSVWYSILYESTFIMKYYFSDPSIHFINDSSLYCGSWWKSTVGVDTIFMYV